MRQGNIIRDDIPLENSNRETSREQENPELFEEEEGC